MSDGLAPEGQKRHLISELGLKVALVGDDLHGTATICREMHVPGTDCLRTSILATWADVLTGTNCIDVFGGRVPVTLDLALDVLRPLNGLGRIDAVSRTVKAGRSVAAAEVEFRADGSDECIALGSASFVAAPDTSLSLGSRASNLATPRGHHIGLTEPFADRAGCVRVAPGIVSLARTNDGLNASNTINGGLLALAVEEAVLSAAPPGTTLSSMTLRYLRPARLGPVVARATRHADRSRVEVRDEGADDRLAVLAMTQAFATP